MEETERKGLPILQFPDAAGFEAWLERHHAEAAGAWLKFAKKGAPHTTLSFARALELALCFGWIDGQVNRFDEHFYLHRFTPRKPRSRWSQINVANATALIEAGRMRPAGLAQVDAARRDGRWDAAYEPQSRAAVPPDLQAALDANPEAKAFFETLRGVARYAFIYRLTTITRPETRARRIERYIELLSARRTLHDRDLS
jgi:uncharacterized protein YdeI (YjbR/CyaY-like superfamily)